MSVRTDLAAALRTAVGSRYEVIDHDANPVAARVTVLVIPEVVNRGSNPGSRDHQVAVVILAPTQTEPDGQLEDALDDVLDVLDDYPNAVWTTAERAVWDDTYPCYRVTSHTSTQTTD